MGSSLNFVREEDWDGKQMEVDGGWVKDYADWLEGVFYAMDDLE